MPGRREANGRRARRRSRPAPADERAGGGRARAGSGSAAGRRASRQSATSGATVGSKAPSVRARRSRARARARSSSSGLTGTHVPARRLDAAQLAVGRGSRSSSGRAPAMRANAARAAAFGASPVAVRAETRRTGRPMWTSVNSKRRGSDAARRRARGRSGDRAAMRSMSCVSRRSDRSTSSWSRSPVSAAWAPRRARAPLGGRSRRLREAYSETIAGTLVSFEMVPVPGGAVTIDGKAVAVAAVLHRPAPRSTWDMYDVVRARPRHAEAAPAGADARRAPVAALRRARLRLGPRRLPGDQRDARTRPRPSAHGFRQKTGKRVSSADRGRVAARGDPRDRWPTG